MSPERPSRHPSHSHGVAGLHARGLTEALAQFLREHAPATRRSPELAPSGPYRFVGSMVPPQSDQPLVLVLVLEDDTGAAQLVERLGTSGALTARERQVARLLVERHTNREIAHALGISENTARHHAQRVLEKLGVRSRRDVRAALEREKE